MEIERLAASLWSNAGIDPFALPLDPFRLAEALEVGIYPVAFHQKEGGADLLLMTLAPGVAPPYEEPAPFPKGTLLINAQLESFRRRMVVAHGLAHLVLGHLETAHSRRDWVGGKSLPDEPEIEREANLLATALLMPETPFRQAWQAVGRLGVQTLAPLFGVPPNAVIFRGWALGLEVPLP